MIESTSNSKIKHLIQLQEKSRIRNKEGLFIAEGIKMFSEAPAEKIREIYVSISLWRQLEDGDGGRKNPEYGRKNPECGGEKSCTGGESPESRQREARAVSVREKLHACRESGIYVEQVSEEVFKKISDTQTPQGILFVMEQFASSLEQLVKKALERQEGGGRPPLFLLPEDIQDPGNLGTMLRTGEGAGVDGVIMSKGTVDIYNPKTIRSTMGSLYRVPFLYVEDMGAAVSLLRDNGITVYAAHLQGKRYFDEIAYEGGSAFLVGNEGNGLKEETAKAADEWLKIPMEGKLESLNAAVSAALLLYRAAGDYRVGRY